MADSPGTIRVETQGLTQAGKSLFEVAAEVHGCARVLSTDCYDGSGFDGPAQEAYLSMIASWAREVEVIAGQLDQLAKDHVGGASAYTGTESDVRSLFGLHGSGN